ncbi:hypothetical protein HZD82_26275, partial [Pantoea agglomerans]|nr:hypothetical protein [Pantoea agglomerans]
MENSEDALGRSMQRAQQFLLLSALLTLMLAIAAVQLKADQRWISVENSEDALGRSMQRAQQFLLLSALLTLMLA